MRRYNSSGIIPVRPKGYQFNSAWTPAKLKFRKARQFLKTLRNEFTYFFSGNISVTKEDVPILCIFHKKKILPYLEILVNIKDDRLIVRYQGRISFQRFHTPLHTAGSSDINLLISYNRTHVSINSNCVESIVKLRQPFARFSHNAIVFLQNRKSSRKFQVSVTWPWCPFTYQYFLLSLNQREAYSTFCSEDRFTKDHKCSEWS